MFISGLILLTISSILYAEQILTLQQILPIAFCGAAMGDHSGYYIGRRMGPRFFETNFAKKRKVFFKSTEVKILRYGNFAIVIGRLVTAIRSIVPLLTGVSGMPRLKFSIYDSLACGIWSLGLGLLIIGVDKIWS
ncbi:VTT domain-containing protein [uncultured Paraglaciecola sp.]|uniref:DedA family protein n=1 Tax=uncultured Paraglaciecola sp. TaxID=1765024 RepID=UPI0026093350|nr:VTT domain-containing protein [uncultured Paraglaciecola sp.]